MMKEKKRVLKNDPLILLQLILTVLGILVSLWLVGNDIRKGDYFPKLFGLPACYLVLAAFLLVLLAMFLKNVSYNRLLYGIGTGAGFLIAVWFSANQILDIKQCPRWFGVPLCYVSLLTFGVLIWLKVYTVRRERDGCVFKGLEVR